MRLPALLALTTIGVAILLTSPTQAALDYAVKLQTGDLQPQPVADLAAKAAGLAGKYVLIQFDRVITAEDQSNLTAQGITILDYVPNNTWVAKIDRPLAQSDVSNAGVRWLDGIRPDQKISPNITQLGIRESSRRPNGRAQFAIILQKDQDLTSWSQRLQTDYSAEILGTEPSVNKIDLVLPEDAYLQLAQLDEVQWIEQAPPPQVEYNNSARVNIGASVVQAAPFNLTGAGIVVGLWDGGLAKGDHRDLSGRVMELDASGYQAHATHVAGTIIGDGTASSGTYKGMAPAATILSQQWWGTASQAAAEYTQATVTLGARCANNSWGYGITAPATQSQCEALLGDYFSEDATLDNIVRGDIGNPISIVWSAGNERSNSSSYCGSIGWTYNTVSALATSKNVISVGAINSDNSSMTSFSSWGPTDDGRIKPDVVGPGCQTNDDHGVTSCSLNGGYTTMCGTSMSGPAVTGVVALLYQQQKLNFPSTSVLPSTVRGILCNTAIDLGATGPDYQYGWGKVDAVKAATKMGIGSPSYVESQISTGQTQSYDLTVPGGAASLKVTIAWDDKGGTTMSSQALINDLDLVLTDPFGVDRQVWMLNGQSPSSAATRGVDHLNNVEMAEVSNPTAGLWHARVTGYNVPYGPQKYSIIFTPDSINTPGATRAFAVFSNGNLTRDPGASELIDFWVVNTGGSSDSVRVRLSDNAGWLVAGLDTSVFLGTQDSSHLVATVAVPGNALAGQNSVVSCRANSKSDTTVTTVGTVTVTAGAIYAVDLIQPTNDTVASPQSVPVSIKVKNTGNITSTIVVTPGNPLAWGISPTSRSASVLTHDSVTMLFTVSVPAEVADQAVDSFRVIATGSGSQADTSYFFLFVSNPVFPPALLTPDTVVYSPNRTFSFTWSGAADSYRLLIATDSNFTNVVRAYPGLSSPSFTMPIVDSLADNRYYWGVRKYVGVDSSSLQLHARGIVVDTKKPSPASPYTPETGTYSMQKHMTFTFSLPAAPGVTEAPEFTILQLANDSAFTVGLKNYSSISGSSFRTPDALAEGRWYWRIQRSDMAGNVAEYSAIPNLIIDSTPPSVSNPVSPANNSTVGTTAVTLRWTVTPPPAYAVSREYYYVHVSKTADFTDNTFSDFIFADSLQLSTSLFAQGQTYYWRVKTVDSVGFYTDFGPSSSFLFRSYICGDVNHSGGVVDLADLSALVAYLISGTPVPPIPQAASLNCDSIIDLADLSRLVAYLTGTPITFCCK